MLVAGIGKSQDPQPAAGRCERGLGGREVGLRLLPVGQRSALYVIEGVLACLGQSGEFHLGLARAQIVQPLGEFTGVDAGKRSALRHLIAEIGDHARDAPRVG